MSTSASTEPVAAPVSDTGWAVGAQLLAIVTGIVGPIIVLVAQGQKNPLTRFHARQSINLSINLFAMFIIAGMLAALVHPAFGTLYLVIFALNFWPIYGAIRAGRAEYWKYPVIPFMR